MHGAVTGGALRCDGTAPVAFLGQVQCVHQAQSRHVPMIASLKMCIGVNLHLQGATSMSEAPWAS